MNAISAERWEPIPGFPGYEASSLGRIRSFIRARIVAGVKQPRILKQKPNKDGYLLVCVTRKQRTVHRLVACAFLGESDLPQVNHLNGSSRTTASRTLSGARYLKTSGTRLKRVEGLRHRPAEPNPQGWVQAERGGFGLMLRGHRD